ncbi:hypothetical protein [Solitalea lacus]|uniref:hypothetical protein n=1 Tax=Solitalea lacus TaxID=2911172 RepID=UPI001EDBAE8B|nr:hypothetical protein [Solitalea lacus]UKJ05799.1 hypothetical protein L2B55_09585 [Solitalea lacus]
MNKNLLSVLLSALALLVFSCESKDAQKTKLNEANIVSTDDLTLNKSSIMEINESPSKELAVREWGLPSTNTEAWKNAKEQSFSDTIRYTHIDALLAINYSTLTIDSTNFIIKNVKINLINGDNDYVFVANIGNQANMGTRQKYNTFVPINTLGQLKATSPRTLKQEGKAVAIFAKGFVKQF